MSKVDEKLGFGQSTILGFQHVAVMYGGAVVVPILIGSAVGLTKEQLVFLISYDLLTCGIATLIQALGIGKLFGIKLPALMAISFVVVGPAISIGKLYGIQGIFGAVIVSGLIVTLLSQFATKLVKYFPPIVTGSVVLIIGVTLMPVAMANAAGGNGAADFGSGKNLGVAAFTFVAFLLLNHFGKGFMKNVAVLIALVAGTVFASFFGMVDPTVVKDAAWFTAVKPFHFGFPTFHLSAILTMTLIGIIIMVESTGVFFALGEVADRKVTGEDVKRGLRAEGIAAVFSGMFNSFNHSTFSQNVGLVLLTKVVSRYVVATGGVILIIIGLVPKIAAVTTMIPSAVLGGAMVPMFGMLLSAAIRMIMKDDLSKASNQLVIGVGVGVGLACAGAPEAFKNFSDTGKLLLESGPVMGAAATFLLNWWLNGPSDHAEIKEENVTLQNTQTAEHSA
ncbi:nucleobase:cation symporter-2 family protein [Aciduricibacillus chroicocephali]|uniref:Nucleobase:cation symporter-2 family protein n=1 Tax=Aciduricibacillus chroicocephali TaxID=3054939 RepID=A0ABY9KWF1_9BACI|nr:nucleobase:cation symporter-2 family protein [Bacillaceae bacterium 44XB]